ncbi:hypothetical protein OJAV_G00026230 [Oryzias javanicus]|uniref:Uncharacterized protein n=1 Tax=Oryzias javanicus TaxID=123683 RepID=A0A437DIW1_ORYJA|nr:hypothetical protein OJAV_G00026230 [Oryzias javanicus]
MATLPLWWENCSRSDAALPFLRREGGARVRGSHLYEQRRSLRNGAVFTVDCRHSAREANWGSNHNTARG